MKAISLNREIIRLAIPNILTNITVPLLSTADTALMGRVSGLHLGAVGLGAMIFNFLYWNFAFLRAGTTGLTAQAFGRKDEEDQIITLARALMVGMLIAFLLLIFQKPLADLSILLMNVDESQVALVREYFFIRIWAAPASICLFALMGWFFGMQNAIYPLILTGVISALNIGLNFYFVLGLKLEVDGVAWATVIAQYTGLLLAAGMFLATGSYRKLLQQIKVDVIFRLKEFSHFLRINRDLFIRTFFIAFTFAFIYSKSSEVSPTFLAINTILMQFVTWMSYGVDGFAYAAESVVGKYKGARKVPLIWQAIRLSFVWGMVLAGVVSLVYGLFGESLVRVLTDQKDVVNATLPYLKWVVIVPLLSAPAFIYDGVFVGLTASKAMRDTMLVAFAVFLAIYYGLGDWLGEDVLWLAFIAYFAVRGIAQGILLWWKGLEIS